MPLQATSRACGMHQSSGGGEFVVPVWVTLYRILGTGAGKGQTQGLGLLSPSKGGGFKMPVLLQHIFTSDGSENGLHRAF